MGERSTILFINLLKVVSLFCERLILKLYSAKYRSMLNSDTQEYYFCNPIPFPLY